jgi:hypothetical protein
VDDLLADFPFTGQADHAAAMLLTPFCRGFFEGGNMPFFMVEKPTPRTGAAMVMVESITSVVLGQPAPATTEGESEAEWQKREAPMYVVLEQPAPDARLRGAQLGHHREVLVRIGYWA